MSFSWDFGRAMRAIHGSLGPAITRRLRVAAPGHGLQHAQHVATITHRTSATAIQWVGAFKPWGFVTRGTRAHEIRPVHATVLRWEGRDGTIHFARRVAHPGTKANRFPMRVWRESLDETRPIIKAATRGGLVIRQVNPYRATLL